MDVTTLVRKVKRLFGEDSTIFIDDQDIYDWINEGRRDISRKAKVGVVSVSTPASTWASTPLVWNDSTHFPPIRRVAYGSVPIPYVDIASFDDRNIDLSASGVPQFYYISGTNLHLWPVPNASDSTSVFVETIPAYEDVDDTSDSLGIPVQYHDDLVLFCLARAHHRNQDHNASERAMAEYNANIFQRREDMHAPDSYPVIRDDPNDMDYDFIYVL